MPWTVFTHDGTGATSAESRFRVQPTVPVGITVAVVYTIILTSIQQQSGIKYTEFFDSAYNAWRGPVLSLAIGSVLLVAFVAWPGGTCSGVTRSGCP